MKSLKDILTEALINNKVKSVKVDKKLVTSIVEGLYNFKSNNTEDNLKKFVNTATTNIYYYISLYFQIFYSNKKIYNLIDDYRWIYREISNDTGDLTVIKDLPYLPEFNEATNIVFPDYNFDKVVTEISKICLNESLVNNKVKKQNDNVEKLFLKQ